MSDKKKFATDLLFVVQMIGMVIFVSGQTARMMQSVQGISPVWMFCAWVFCLVNVGLALRSWKDTKTRATAQLLITHGCWTLGAGLLAAIIAWKIREVSWGWYDTICIVLVVIASAATLLVSRRTGLGITDPIVRGMLAAILRGIPHITLAYKIGLLGGAGLSPLTIGAAHATALVRICQLAFAVREVGWDRGRRGLAIAEATSEGTWVVVTVVWLVS